MKDVKSNISILTEWEVIQERFLEFYDNLKLHTKEQMRKIVYQETTYLKPQTKGAPKNVKPTSKDNSRMRPPSYFDYKFYLDINNFIYKKNILTIFSFLFFYTYILFRYLF